MSFQWFLSLALLVLVVHARLPDGRLHGNMMRRPSMPRVAGFVEPLTDVSGQQLPPLNKTYYFDQLIDHNNPSLGTFKQRYFHTWEFYEPGTSTPACTRVITPIDMLLYRRPHRSDDTGRGGH